MDPQQESLLKLICSTCSPFWKLSLYKEHIIINLPEVQEDYRKAYQQVKHGIKACISEHFADRTFDLLFEIRNGSWNFSFKVGRNVWPDLTALHLKPD